MISLTSPIKTPWHAVPAGPKLAFLCVATVALFIADSIAISGAACLAVLGAYSVGGRTFLVEGMRVLRPLWPFFALILAWHIVTASLEAGAQIALRLAAAVSLANLVTLTTRLEDIIAVLRRILSPFRYFGLRTEPIELAIALVVRFTPVLAQKGTQLTEAWRSRSLRRPGWRILVPFTLLAIDDAERVAESLRARGGLTGNEQE